MDMSSILGTLLSGDSEKTISMNLVGQQKGKATESKTASKTIEKRTASPQNAASPEVSGIGSKVATSLIGSVVNNFLEKK